MTKRKKSAFPFSSQFSPSQIDLARLLELVNGHEGDGDAIARAIKDVFFSSHASASTDPEYNRMKLAKNTRSALVDYDLLDEPTWRLSPMGGRLYVLRNDPDELYAEFGRHILLNKRGLDLIDIVKTLKTSGSQVTLEHLAVEARKRGLYLPSGSMQMSDLRAWLGKAGVFTNKDIVSDIKVKELLGYDTTKISELASLPPVLSAFLKALANFNEKPPIVSSKVAHMAERLYNVRLPEKSLPKTLEPLERLGLVTLEKTTGGRGAKPYIVTPTQLFNTKFLGPLLDALAGRTQLPSQQLARPLMEVVDELGSPDKHKKGIALELVAANLARLLGLDIVGWRLRANETGGAEVDLVADSARIVFNRWQIQCKNTNKVSLDDVAKEVGLTSQLKSTAVVMVTTGNFSKSAQDYANNINRTTNLSIILVSGSELKEIAADNSRVATLFDNKAQQINDLKREGTKLS